MYYLIQESLQPCAAEAIRPGGAQFVAVLTAEEWKQRCDSFDMFIDMGLETAAQHETKAVVNLDSLTGTFCVPDRQDICGARHGFAFALDEKGVVLIDDSGYAGALTERIRATKKWRLPSLERFLYDFLEAVIADDLHLLEEMEKRLNALEEEVLRGGVDELPDTLNDIRGDLLDLRVHYEQLIDLGQELEENENGFFREENLRYFRLFTERVMRLQDTVNGLREYVVQLRDLIHTRLEVRQNKIMTVLTVVTAIFMPLTLIAGWYGMNFRYMPELEQPWAYPAVIAVSVAIVVVCLIWFRKKKWL